MTRALIACQRVFLCLFAFFLPISISGAELSLGLMTISLFILTLSDWRRFTPFPVPFLIPLLVFLAGHILSSLTGPDILASLSSIDWIFIAMPVTVAVMRLIGRDKRPVAIFVTVGVIVSIYAIVQHFVGVDIVRSPGEKAIIEYYGSEGRYLPIGTFRHHLTYAHLFQFVFLFLFTIALRHVKDYRHFHLTLPAAVVVGISLVFTYSRGVWVAVTLSSILIVVILWGRRGTIYSTISVVVLLLIILSNGSYGERLKSVFSQDANIERLTIYQIHLDVIRDHPVMGIGSGRYRETMQPYYERYSPPDEMPRVHAHNNLIQVWLNAGLIGLAGFLWLNIAFLHGVWIYVRRRICKKPHDRTILIAGFACVLAFLISGLSQYNLGDSEVSLTYWFIMGLAIGVMDGHRDHLEIDGRRG
jgi:O-antigen ligase